MNTLLVTQFLTVAIAHLLAVMSPGPDFVVVSKNSLSYSRKIGVYTALGVALGIAVHVSYCLLGIGFIISKSIIVFNVIKLLGAGYLFYIGYKMLRSKKVGSEENQIIKKKENFTPIQAVKNGFYVNALNPKATLFFLALFTQVISPGTSDFVKIVYGIEMMVMTFVWFTAVSALFSNGALKSKVHKYQHIVERFTGAVLIAIGMKVVMSQK